MGGHFFTADFVEKGVVENNENLNPEGLVLALSDTNEDVSGSTAVYRFLNKALGSHIFTAFEVEKEHLLTLSDFVYEGVAFRAFGSDSETTVAVHRFFNIEVGGHFFTASELEKILLSKCQRSDTRRRFSPSDLIA